jgi:hypothetical protein
MAITEKKREKEIKSEKSEKAKIKLPSLGFGCADGNRW